MALILIGLFIFIGSIIVSNRPETQGRNMFNTLRYVGLGLAILGFVTSCVVQIDAGQIGVKKLFGNVQSDILKSGLHFINPLMDVEVLEGRTQNYTMSGSTDAGENQGEDAMRVLTSDGLEVIMDLTVLFRVIDSEAPKIIREIGPDYKAKIVRPISRTKIRDNAVYYQAIELYSTKRDEFQQKIFKSIDDNFRERGMILEQLLVRNITLPNSVKSSIEEKIQAEQDAQKMTFVLQKEKQEAERKRVEAQGIADYQKIINTGLTDKQLQYEMIKAYQILANSPNAKIIVMDKSAPVIIDGK